MMSKRKHNKAPSATLTRAKIWAHRQGRDQVGYEVAGFPAKTHRAPEAQYFNVPAFVLQKFSTGPDFDITVSVTLAEARAIRDQWDAAIKAAEGNEPCEATCTWCRADSAPR